MSFFGDWEQALRMVSDFASGGFAKRLARAELNVAERLRGFMVRGIDSEAPGGAAFTAHSAATLPLRRSITGATGGKIMVATATMRNNIRVVPAPGGGAFVGIHRGAPGGRVRIAQIQEEGRKIRMTDRMRRFIMMHLRRVGMPYTPGQTRGYITIQPRPFITPIVQQYRDQIGTMILQDLLRQMQR